MEAIAESVLVASAQNEALLGSTEVVKPFDVIIDDGDVAAIDGNPLDAIQLRERDDDDDDERQDEYLKELARDNTQLIFNSLFKLPRNTESDARTPSGKAIFVTLPDPKTVLPREKPVPKPKPLTKWEEFAKLKGIQKTKKSRKVWDEEAKEWRPRWGYKRANDETKQWVIEVPQNADPMEDQFAKIKNAKKERIAKNELLRLRNIGRNMKKSVGIGITPTTAPDKDQFSRQHTAARVSDASMGKFSQVLKKEKNLKPKNEGKRRKFEPNFGSLEAEKKRSLDILKSIGGSKAGVDVKGAVRKQLSKRETKKNMRKERRETGTKTKSVSKGRRSKSAGKGKVGGK